MEMTGKVWMFYNAVTKQQSKPLSTAKAQKFIMKIKVKDIHHYYLWTPGWNEWKPMIPYLQSGENSAFVSPIPALPSEPSRITIQTSSHTATAITQVTNDNLETPFDENNSLSYTAVELSGKSNPKPDYDFFNDFSAADIDINADVKLKKKKKEVKLERREDMRHDFKIEILLISANGKSFRSYSKNISLGGSMLEDPIPREFFDGEFEVVIMNKFGSDNQDKVLLKGKVIPDIAEPRRLIFKETPIPVMKRLEKLLKAYENIKSAKKKTG
jgi:hypothetical protein